MTARGQVGRIVMAICSHQIPRMRCLNQREEAMTVSLILRRFTWRGDRVERECLLSEAGQEQEGTSSDAAHIGATLTEGAVDKVTFVTTEV